MTNSDQTRYCIVSTCGTSILTNQGSETRNIITKYAHVKDKAVIENSDREQLETLIATVRKELKETHEIADLKKLAAEINGITLFYDNKSPNSGDIHFLISTDTWLGGEAASLLEEWLKGKGVTHVGLPKITDLGAQDLSEFQSGIAELVGWCHQQLPGYRDSKYKIIFQLNGGFKSIQGVMQSLAPFYSDETLYIFESGNELLRIPRLPVKLDLEEVVKENFRIFRRLKAGLSVSEEETKTIPQTLIFSIDKKPILSAWGELVWNQVGEKLLTEDLFDSPSEKVVYENEFKASVKKFGKDKLKEINERITDLACYMEKPDRPNPKRLDLKELKGNKCLPSTHECDAWADGNASRLFGHRNPNDQSVFILDRLSKHL